MDGVAGSCRLGSMAEIPAISFFNGSFGILDL